MKCRVKDWENHQHYKERKPPWIKLHRGLLDDFDFHCLPVASRALAPMLWLLASDSEGVVDCSPKFLGFRLRMSVAEVADAVKPLIDNGWMIPEQGASDALADCLQDACLETETETEGEKEDRSRATAPDRFPDFWAVYPKKVKKQDARKVWKSRKLDAKADDLIADVKTRQAKDGRWLEGFVPDPTTYLRGSRWEDELEKPRINGSAKPAWAQVPRDDDKLWPWAKEHGYLNPGTMNYYQYRQALQAAVEERMGGR
jgi:hypothetical protein